MTSKPPYLYIFHVKNIKGRKNSGQKEVKSFLWIPISESESRALNYYIIPIFVEIIIRQQFWWFWYLDIPINTYTTCWFFCCITTYVCSSYLILIYLWIILPVKKKLKFGKRNLWKQGIAQTELPLLHLKQFCFFMQNCPRYENACLM